MLPNEIIEYGKIVEIFILKDYSSQCTLQYYQYNDDLSLQLHEGIRGD